MQASMILLLVIAVVSSEQLFLEPVPNHPNAFSKIYLPHWKPYRYRYLPSVVYDTTLFVTPDPWGEPFPEFSNTTVYELCEGFFCEKPNSFRNGKFDENTQYFFMSRLFLFWIFTHIQYNKSRALATD